VPDTFRGEFVNVAVIAGSEETGEWLVRRVDNSRHPQRLAPTTPIAPVWSYLDGVEALIDRLDAGSGPSEGADLNRAWLESEHRRLGNVVQLTTPRLIVAESIETAVDSMFDQFVVDPEPRSRKTRTAAVSALRTAFGETSLVSGGYVYERVRAVVGKQQAPVDFAVANGRLAQLAHGWSFETQDTPATVQTIKAWCWTLRDLRDHGGKILVRAGAAERPSYSVPNDVPIEIAYVPPQTDDGRRSLDEALEVFQHLDVHAVPTDQAHLIAENAVRTLHDGEVDHGSER
jgi:hypothetical protein